jgi:hypothetical protein
MTVSSASIPVLHSAEVVPFTHKSCYPSAKGSRLPIHLYRGGHDLVAEVSAANKESLNGPADPCSSLKNEERPGEWAPHAEAQAPSSTRPQALAIDPPEQATGVSQGPRARYREGAERERERETARWVPRGSARGAGSGTGLAALRKAEVGWIGDSRPS